jgi:hypothetical protein
MTTMAYRAGSFTGFVADDLRTERPASSEAKAVSLPSHRRTEEVGSHSVDHCTAADVMRKLGFDDKDIEFAFGYVPRHFQPRG